MLIDFFMHLKERRIPVTITEYLALLEALQTGLVNCSLDNFYALARICLVKNEMHYDRFDLAFSEYFEHIRGNNQASFQENWLKQAAKKILNEEELAKLGMQSDEADSKPDAPSFDDLNEKAITLEDNMTGNQSSSFDTAGIKLKDLPPEEMEEPPQKSVKAWNSRDFKALDDELELGTRNIKIALRRLRKFAREGTPDELDLEGTISSTARNAGWLDLVMRPERKNKVKVLLLFDIGGSMAPYVKRCEELFSAAKTEFKHMDYFYFHNCIYDTVWKYDTQAATIHYPIHFLINKFGKDFKLILVGDAAMGPTEISHPSTNYYNTEGAHSGETWLRSLLNHFKHAVWLNPEPERFWHVTKSIEMIRDIMENRMYPLTLRGLDDAMQALSK